MSLDVYLYEKITYGEHDYYWGNITHNLREMADEAGIYEVLWRHDESNITKAEQLIEPLTKGLQLLKGDPERFKKLNPKNGWGTYEVLVEFVANYLEAAKEYPLADVRVSR